MVEREIAIREARVEDLDAITRLYVDFMFESFLSKFGGLFVRSYLDCMIRSSQCCTLVAEKDRIAGFIVAALDGRKMAGELASSGSFRRALFSQCLKHPFAAIQGLQLFLYPLHTRCVQGSAELLFIAVDPAFRQQGLGRGLLYTMLDTLKEKGEHRVKVSTHLRNQAVNTLLERTGFRKRRTFRMFHNDMAVYDFQI